MMPPPFDIDTQGSWFEQVPDASKMSRFAGNSYLSDCVYDAAGNV